MKKILLLLKRPAVWLILICCSLLGVAALYLLNRMGYTVDDAKVMMNQMIDYISQYPALAYLSVILVAGVPIPLTPIIVTAAIVFTNKYGLTSAVFIIYSAMALGMIWTYLISAYPLRSLFDKLISKYADQFPEVPEQHKTKVALIVRITPGIPYFIQNYFLGVSRIPFIRYLFISLSIHAFYTPAFVIGGGAIFEGEAGLAISAICLLIVIGIVINSIRSKSKIAQGT